MDVWTTIRALLRLLNLSGGLEVAVLRNCTFSSFWFVIGVHQYTSVHVEL